MKRKIVIGLAVSALAFLLGGLYILLIIDRTTDELDRLILLHQVEILREHYLIQIRRVQSDLAVGGTRFARDFETIASHVSSMERVVGTCLGCHHAPAVEARIADLEERTRSYEDALSRVLTLRAGRARTLGERDQAFQLGEDLIERVSDMIAMTGARLESSTRHSLARIDATKNALMALLAAGPLISIALGFLLVRGLSRPLALLLTATRRLKVGDLDHRVPPLTDEFAVLGSAFNEMFASLKEQIAANARAERMAMLGQVSAGLAHEIKNPLAGIKAAMDVLVTESGMPEEDREVLRKVRKEADRVEALMRSFLNFARPPKPQPAEVDVNALVASSLGLYARGARREAAAASEVRVATDLVPVPVITTDPTHLEQVLINLVLNAFDSMPKGGDLTVRTRHDAGAGVVSVEVADTGAGIAPEHVSRLFEPFFTTKSKGTGLGLAISRQLVEQQGGTLTVASVPGRGSTFTIRLPAAGRAKASA